MGEACASQQLTPGCCSLCRDIGKRKIISVRNLQIRHFWQGWEADSEVERNLGWFHLICLICLTHPTPALE